jgi:hypothetical protein
MSDETASAPENTPTPKAAAPRVRRISTPRPKKVAKEAAQAPAEAVAPEPAPALAPEVVSIPFPTSPRREERREERADAAPQGENDWPEPDAESGGGGPSQSESSKRKRRRRKGKGQGQSQGNGPQNNAGEPSNEESRPMEAPQEPRPRPQPAPQQSQPQPQPPRAKIDPELLTKMAWKVYLAEVSEEGVALIGDNDAKDLARRCFRLAEIFIEEQFRRR